MDLSIVGLDAWVPPKLKDPRNAKFGRRPHPNQHSKRSQRSEFFSLGPSGVRRFDPSSPHARPDPTSTRPRALKHTKSPAISCELRSTSRQTMFESKVDGHREAGPTLSSAPFGQLYLPVLAPPCTAVKPAQKPAGVKYGVKTAPWRLPTHREPH